MSRDANHVTAKFEVDMSDRSRVRTTTIFHLPPAFLV